MAFSDPQSITISGVTSSLPRVSTGANQAVYQDATGLLKLSASSAYGRRNRRVLRFDHSKIAANPFDTAKNESYSMSNYIVFDCPKVGYTNAEITAIYAGFKALYTASSDALITKLIGGES